VNHVNETFLYSNPDFYTRSIYTVIYAKIVGDYCTCANQGRPQKYI